MEYIATGVMSGTSLDGMDIAVCRFKEEMGRWTYEVVVAETLDYPDYWTQRLSGASALAAEDLIALHFEYGHYTGSQLNDFFKRHTIHDPGIISCHGHTIFHRPEQGYTFQLGHGAAIASNLNTPVISDFRSTDIALQGQGAPLVPIGDQLLFHHYDYCLNLGGFANISTMVSATRMAWDICPVNIIVNRLVQQARNSGEMARAGIDPGKTPAFDHGGEIGASGKVCKSLLDKLNTLPYYSKTGPKSLGAEWVDENIWPLIHTAQLDFRDTIRTFYSHIAQQIKASCATTEPDAREKTLLITGGGAHNHFLTNLIRKETEKNIRIIIPDNVTVEFKEAIIFALLGVLWVRDEVNCMASVTGSIRDSIGGSMHKGDTNLPK